MKKQFCFLVITWFALLLFPKVFGQLPERPQQNIKKLNKFKIGIISGLNYATITRSGPRGSEMSRRFGFLIGFYSIDYFDQSISLEMDVLFSQKGANQKGEFYDGTSIHPAASRYISNYIELAPLMVINFTHVRKVKPFLLIGPGFDLRMWSSVMSKIPDYPTQSDDLTGQGKMEIGLILGAGSHFKYKTVISKIEIRYTRGLGHLFSSDTQSECYNSVLSVILGTSFGNNPRLK